MADLKPDNGDDINAKENIWTLGYKPHESFWMVCRYKGTDVRLIRRIDTPPASCKTMRTNTHGDHETEILGCK